MAKVRKKAEAGPSDLEILFPERSVLVSGRVITVKEYPLMTGIRLASSYGEQVRALKSALAGEPNADHFSPVIASLISESTGVDVLMLAGAVDEEWRALTESWLAVNGHLFATPEESKGKGLDWGEVIAELVMSGHDPEKAKQYTARQMGLYFKAAQKLNRQRRAAAVVDTNAAFAGGSHADGHVKDLVK